MTRFVIHIVFATLVSGCALFNPDNPLTTPPLAQTFPISAALHIPRETRDYVGRADGGGLWFDVALGSPSVDMLRFCFQALFEKVIEIKEPPPTKDNWAIVLVPYISKFEYYEKVTAGGVVKQATVGYRIEIYDSSGRLIASPDYSSVATKYMTAGPWPKDYISRAMRDTAAKIVQDLPTNPNLRKVLDALNKPPSIQ